VLADRTVLITGGTGSFGNAVLRRLLTTPIREVRIFSRDEKKQEDMRIALGDDRVKFYIGDVRNRDGLVEAMRGVDYVFHAAALKQVPSCEFYPMEAVRTNVLGTENVLTAAIEARVGRVVILSTDKAVYPVNAMGISKAMAEKLVVAKSRTVPDGGPVFCCTRYGNVMGSRGSVIPVFGRSRAARLRAWARGGHLHPEGARVDRGGSRPRRDGTAGQVDPHAGHRDTSRRETARDAALA
jgi:UDP-N-acetylglucosamine 4,6-dehydratase